MHPCYSIQEFPPRRGASLPTQRASLRRCHATANSELDLSLKKDQATLAPSPTYAATQPCVFTYLWQPPPHGPSRLLQYTNTGSEFRSTLHVFICPFLQQIQLRSVAHFWSSVTIYGAQGTEAL